MSRERRLPADCRAFETYLNLLLTHPVIADDSTLVKFVTEPQAVPRVRLKKGNKSRDLCRALAITTRYQIESLDRAQEFDSFHA